MLARCTRMLCLHVGHACCGRKSVSRDVAGRIRGSCHPRRFSCGRARSLPSSCGCAQSLSSFIETLATTDPPHPRGERQCRVSGFFAQRLRPGVPVFPRYETCAWWAALPLCHTPILLTHACPVTDGYRFTTAGRDGTVRIFDTESGQQTHHVDLGSGIDISWLDVAVNNESILFGYSLVTNGTRRAFGGGPVFRQPFRLAPRCSPACS